MNYEQLQALLTQAEELSNKGNYDQAEKLANEVLAQLEEPHLNPPLKGGLSDSNSDSFPTGEGRDGVQLRAEATRLLGGISWRRGDYAGALEYFNSALFLCEEIDDKVGIAKTLCAMGNVHRNLSEYPKALECYGKALAIDEEFGNHTGIAGNLHNIGLVHYNFSDYTMALQYYLKAMTINTEINNRAWLATNLCCIGNVQIHLSDYPKALEYYGKALTIAEELGNKVGVALNLGNIGIVHEKRSDHPKALEYFGKALAIDEELSNRAGVARHLGNIGTVHKSLDNHELALEYFKKALQLSEEIGAAYPRLHWLLGLGQLLSKSKQLSNHDSTGETYLKRAIEDSTALGVKHITRDASEALYLFYKGEEQWQDALTMKELHEKLTSDINLEEVKKQESIREQQKAIEIARTRATAEKNILNNILPEEITQRLIKGENPIADHFACVSVLFMDIVDFTPLASSITAQQLVHLLNAIFTTADRVMREFGMEKIKTIGDAYMAVAGAPVVQTDHAHRAAQAALKLLEVMENLVVTFPDNYGDRSWIESIPEIKVRIGLHCGPVAAGVVGENKFLYDLWGDAVNTAARMESHGEAGRIHISDDFRIAVETCRGTSLHTIEFIERGEMEIKGKGTMRTYFLEKA